MKPRLLYFYDALCGWCFGFGPTMAKLADTFGNRLNVEVISGGLRPEPEPLSLAAPYIRNAYPKVERATGVRFGAAFVDGALAQGDLVLESRSPAIALALVREAAPTRVLTFSRLVQEALYVHGRGLSDPATYGPLVAEVGGDSHAFLEAFGTSSSRALAEADFAVARGFGVSSYPTLALEKNGELVLVTQGFQPFEVLRPRIEALLLPSPSGSGSG